MLGWSVSNCYVTTLFFLKQRKREIIFPQKNVPDMRIDRGTADCEAEMLQKELPRPVRCKPVQNWYADQKASAVPTDLRLMHFSCPFFSTLITGVYSEF